MQFKEEAVFTLKFDGKPVVNQLGELEKSLIDAKEAQKGLERGTKEWAESKAQIKELEATIKQVRAEMGVTGMTVEQLRGYYKQLSAEIDKLTPGTDAYVKKAAEMQEVNTALATHRATVRASNEEIEKQPTLWERAKGAATGFFAAFSATELIEQAFNFVKDGIKKALELEDQMSGVAKSTGQSAEEVRALSKELDKIDTRSTKESLMGIAQIGGQLGVANEQLLGFVESVDRANVALGDEFTGGAEEVSASLGGLQKLFKETKDLQAGEAIDKIGSAINELGAAGSATGPVVADFTARMGQLGDLSPQISQTLGLGAAFQELGLTAENSASGLSSILLTAAKDTGTFAQQIGVSKAKMQEWINTNPNEFLLRLAESLKNVPADQLATRLHDLGINGDQAIKVMSLLKDQTEMVREKQQLSSRAMAEGTSLQKEFNTVNSNAAAQYEKSQKALNLIATEIGQGLLPGVTAVTRGVVTFVGVIRSVPEFVSENRTALAALGVAMLTLNGNLVLATANSIAQAAAEKARLVWTNSATAAQWLLNAAMTANPIALVVTGVALLVAGLTTLYNNSTTLRGAIAGTWEAMKTGVDLIADLTDKAVDLVAEGLEPLEPVLSALENGLGFVWGLVEEGVKWFASLGVSARSLVSDGLSRINTALEPVRAGLSSFWNLIDTGINKIKAIGGAIASFLHVDDVVSKVKSAAGLIGDAFNKGYGDKLEEDRPKQVAAYQATLNTKKAAETKVAGELADIVTESDQKALDKKAVQAEKHRATEAKKAKDAAEKQAAEVAKAEADAIKKTEEARIAAIADDLERDQARLQFKYDQEVAAIGKSKASQGVKAAWEKALTEQLHADLDKIETQHRTKHEKEEAEAAKRTLDLKIKLGGDEKADKLQKLEDVAAAQRIQIEKDVKNETDKAALLKQINEKLIDDKARVEEEFRQKKAKEDAALMDAQFQATLADADARLRLASNNAQAIYEAKKQRLDAEYAHNKAKLEREAAEQIAHNNANIADTDRRAAANKATDDLLKANLTANDVKYEQDKTALTAEKNEARRKNHQEYFTAIKALMEGDFTQFTDILTKKLLGEKTQLTEKQKANIATIDAVGEYTVLAVNALNKLNQMKLEKELKNIQNERDSQLAAWKDKYDKGLINKDTYEKGVDKINKEADAKMKAAQLQAFRNQQKLDIAMAIVNGAQAALKSLATLGWPLGLIGVAAAAVTTAVQIGIIKNQQPPQMKRGGYVQNAGVVDGPQHGRKYGDSGLAITRRDTGEEVAEMEGGEPVMVLSRNTYSNNRRVVDALMHSSLHRGGAPIYRRGGIFGGDGGSYSDYVGRRFRNGGVMFDDGGWMAGIDNEWEDGGYQEKTPAETTTAPPAETEASAASTIDSITDEQIKQSQAAMDGIRKNTEATVAALEAVVKWQDVMVTQLKYNAQLSFQQTDQLRTELLAKLDALNESQGQQLVNVRDGIIDRLAELTSALGVAFPNLGGDLAKEFTELRTMLAGQLTELSAGLHADLVTLTESNQTETSLARTSSHDDVTALSATLATALTTLQNASHDDVLALTESNRIETVLARLSSEKDTAALITALTGLITELKNATHGDLVALTDTTRNGLGGVQGAVGSGNNALNYHSDQLTRIAQKEFSFSYQNFVHVDNQVSVVVKKSDLVS